MTSQSSRREVLQQLGCLAGLTFAAPVVPLTAQSVTQTHRPVKPNRAWFFLVDTTTSVSPAQFDGIKRGMSDLLTTKVAGSDMVWIGEISDAPLTVTGVAMPYVGGHRSDRSADEMAELDRARRALAAKLAAMGQRAKATDLKSPVEKALGVLADQRMAAGRVLVIGSDFISDQNGHQPSPVPPPPSRGVSAAGDQVMLVVAEPDSGSMQKLRMSPADIYDTVTTGWKKYFADLGAVSVSAKHVDSIVV